MMKTKLLGVIAACVLVLTARAANAETYTLAGTFAAGVDSSNCGGLFPTVTPCNLVWPGGTLSGTLDITDAATPIVINDLTVSIGGATPTSNCCLGLQGALFGPTTRAWDGTRLNLLYGDVGGDGRLSASFSTSPTTHSPRNISMGMTLPCHGDFTLRSHGTGPGP